MGEYRKAEVYLNGHSTTMNLQYSDLTNPYCFQCGAKTIRECPSCNSSIRGNYRVEGVISMDDPVPAYCHSCGNAYPWTHTALNSAKELVEELDQLDREEKDKLNGSIGGLVRDSPQAQVAAVRCKKLVRTVFEVDDALAQELSSVTEMPVDAIRTVEVKKSFDGDYDVDFLDAAPVRTVEKKRILTSIRLAGPGKKSRPLTCSPDALCRYTGHATVLNRTDRSSKCRSDQVQVLSGGVSMIGIAAPCIARASCASAPASGPAPAGASSSRSVSQRSRRASASSNGWSVNVLWPLFAGISAWNRDCGAPRRSTSRLDSAYHRPARDGDRAAAHEAQDVGLVASRFLFQRRAATTTSPPEISMSASRPSHHAGRRPAPSCRPAWCDRCS